VLSLTLLVGLSLFESPALWQIKTHRDNMGTNSQERAYRPTHKLKL